MIRYGLKLWTKNTDLFIDAVTHHAAGDFDFIELYAHPDYRPGQDQLSLLKGIPVEIHATNQARFHEFVIGQEEKEIWRWVASLADFFESSHIVVHPGRDHTLESFQENLALIDDPRILIENMAGLDLEGKPMFGQKLSDLENIRTIKPICFDFEKAVKAARYQSLDYKAYIAEAVEKLSPSYFHVSGGDSTSPTDQHTDLFESDIDFAWIKHLLEALTDAPLVFETPKADGIANDLKNMRYFKEL